MKRVAIRRDSSSQPHDESHGSMRKQPQDQLFWRACVKRCVSCVNRWSRSSRKASKWPLIVRFSRMGSTFLCLCPRVYCVTADLAAARAR